MIYTLDINTRYKNNNSIVVFEEFDMFFKHISNSERELTNILEGDIFTETVGKKFSEKFRQFMKMVLKYIEKFINWLRGPFKKSVKEAVKQQQYDNNTNTDDAETKVKVEREYKFIIYKHDFNKIMDSLNTLLYKIQMFTTNSRDELREKPEYERKELEAEYLEKYWIIISDILNYDIKNSSDFNNYISYITETEEKSMSLDDFLKILEDQQSISIPLMGIKMHCASFYNYIDSMDALNAVNVLDKFVQGIFNIIMNITRTISSCVSNLASQYNKYINDEDDTIIASYTNESTIFSNVKII